VADKEEKDRQSFLPEKIITLARQQGINIADDPELLEIIEQVNPKRKIPDDIYALIAEIIIHVYKSKNQWKSTP